MGFRDELKQFTLSKFSFLTDVYFFSQPKITENIWITQIAFIKKEFAICVILDFFDFLFYVSLEKVQNCEILSDHSSIESNRYSKYLLSLISEKKWDVEETKLSKLKLLNAKRCAEMNRQEYFEILLLNKEILDSLINKILDNESILFD